MDDLQVIGENFGDIVMPNNDNLDSSRKQGSHRVVSYAADLRVKASVFIQALRDIRDLF